MPLKLIVTDTYDFPTLIRRGYVYVDKTAFLRRMTSGVDASLFFISHLRRVVAIGVNYNSRVADVEVKSEVVSSSDEVVRSHSGLRKQELVQLVGKSRATRECVLASVISLGQV